MSQEHDLNIGTFNIHMSTGQDDTDLNIKKCRNVHKKETHLNLSMQLANNTTVHIKYSHNIQAGV